MITAAVPPATTKNILWMKVIALAISSLTVLGPPTASISFITWMSGLMVERSILNTVLPLKYHDNPIPNAINDANPVARPAPNMPMSRP